MQELKLHKQQVEGGLQRPGPGEKRNPLRPGGQDPDLPRVTEEQRQGEPCSLRLTCSYSVQTASVCEREPACVARPSAAAAREEEEEIEEETVRRRLVGQDEEEEQTQILELIFQSQEVQNRKQVQSHRHGLEQRRG